MDRDTLTPGDLRALAALASSAAARAEQDMERCREEGRGLALESGDWMVDADEVVATVRDFIVNNHHEA